MDMNSLLDCSLVSFLAMEMLLSESSFELKIEAGPITLSSIIYLERGRDAGISSRRTCVCSGLYLQTLRKIRNETDLR